MPGYWPRPRAHHSAGTLVRAGERLHVSDLCQEGKTLCGSRLIGMEVTSESWTRIASEPDLACMGCLRQIAQIRADYRKAMYGE